jgi:hypothetical protein
MTSFSSSGPAEQPFGNTRWQGACGGRWHAFEIAALVISFAFWWPLGLAVLALKLAQRAGYRTNHIFEWGQRAFSDFTARRQPSSGWQPFATGNSAFDDWKAAEMTRLDEERRKLDAAAKEFAEHLDNLRRARDREEFESFMAARRNRSPEA